MSGPLAVSRALEVLGHLAAVPAGASLAELTRTLKVPKSSLLGVLRGMAASGHVRLDGRLYSIGPESLSLAHDIVRGPRNLAELADPILRTLAADTGETSILAIMTKDERAVEYVAKVESNTAIRFAATVGDRRPLHASASGWLLAAHHDDGWIDRYLASARLDRQTNRTIVDPERLRATFRKVRAEGFASTTGEMTEGVAGLAVPVFGPERIVCAALTIGGPIERMMGQRQHLLHLLEQAAANLSTMLTRPI